MLTAKEAAEFLNLSRRTIEAWLSTKRYPGLKSVKL
ncbi:MAG: helix-turn-helix domain-containing protein [Puniceicoccales bacterium]|nr:helix-turn-helix domain-containing protein [Puniceicoccales bacterium]